MVTRPFLLQWLSHFAIVVGHFLELVSNFWDSVTCTIVIQPFLLHGLNHFLNFISHFLDFVTRHSDSAFFFATVSHPFFPTVTRSFLDFVMHFWNFVTRYSSSTILLQYPKHFAIVLGHFFRTRQQFLKFCRMHYSDLTIFATGFNHFLDFISYF
jgi:hypothetical protein